MEVVEKLIRKYKRQNKKWEKLIEQGVFLQVQHLINKKGVMDEVIRDLEKIVEQHDTN